MRKAQNVHNQIVYVAELSLNMLFLNQILVIVLHRFKQYSYSAYVNVTTESMRSFIHSVCEMPFRY